MNNLLYLTLGVDPSTIYTLYIQIRRSVPRHTEINDAPRKKDLEVPSPE